ncbi:hypothetical protein CLOM_g22453 [Closterium sp. NIES-68]|nr:hypothetical protein CLOM_g22453 [Closterium sp. NIES-68]GJP70195.1 hypothetical protein CLOP_g1167 [Closterium sp. NIES-67]
MTRVSPSRILQPQNRNTIPHLSCILLGTAILIAHHAHLLAAQPFAFPTASLSSDNKRSKLIRGSISSIPVSEPNSHTHSSHFYPRLLKSSSRDESAFSTESSAAVDFSSEASPTPFVLDTPDSIPASSSASSSSINPSFDYGNPFTTPSKPVIFTMPDPDPATFVTNPSAVVTDPTAVNVDMTGGSPGSSGSVPVGSSFSGIGGGGQPAFPQPGVGSSSKPGDSNGNQVTSSLPAPRPTGAVFNVRKFGAKGNGESDDSGGFLAAFAAACNASISADANTGPTTMLVPGGYTFYLTPIQLIGPCGPGGVSVQIDGNITAPEKLSKYPSSSRKGIFAFLQFGMIANLTVVGSGFIDGQGESFWEKGGDRPVLVYVYLCNGTSISGITLQNAPFFHLQVTRCVGVRIFDFKTNTPAESRNTDGIHVSVSTNVEIRDCTLAGGDDNIVLWDGAREVSISDITIFSGHGISIGALGSGKISPLSCVSDVTVKSVRFFNTKIGLRIKTFQGGAGAATNIAYENITMEGVRYPLVLDQFYNGGSLLSRSSSKSNNVAISDVSFSNIQGTAIGNEGAVFRCSRTVPCTKVRLNNVNITAAGQATPLVPVSEYVYGKVGGDVSLALEVESKADSDELERTQKLVSACASQPLVY